MWISGCTGRRKLAGAPYHGRVRRAVLRDFPLCGAAPGGVRPGLDGVSSARPLREVLRLRRSRQRARASFRSPLPERPRASAAAAAGGGLARIARSDAPVRLLVGRAHARGHGRRSPRSSRALGASPRALRASPACSRRPCRPGGRGRGRAHGPTRAWRTSSATATLAVAADEFDSGRPRRPGSSSRGPTTRSGAGEAHRGGRRRLRADGGGGGHRARRDPPELAGQDRGAPSTSSRVSSDVTDFVGHGTFVDRADRGARRQRARRQGRGRQHQDPGGAGLRERAASRSRT